MKHFSLQLTLTGVGEIGPKGKIFDSERFHSDF
jgi:hypothetical protein